MADHDRLYAVPLADFVAERNRLAKELRAAGEREEAERVAKLPKPSAAEWALRNADPELTGAWRQATADLRAASTGAGDLRAAMAAHREATERLLDAVTGDLSPAMAERARALLAEAAGAEDGPEGLFGSGSPAARPAPRKGAGKADEAREQRRAELRRRVAEARAEAERLAGEHAEREERADAAEERLEEARRGLRRLESEAGAARSAADDAERALAAARRDLGRLEARLERTG